ncbi:MAG: lactate utilization protein C, partial [Bacteroidota bacterium]
VSITLCECLIAATGSVAISSSQNCSIRSFISTEIHIVFAFTWQIVSNISDALIFIQKKYPDNQSRQITFISGPSRTADIEQEIVFGAHGPKELYVFLLDE